MKKREKLNGRFTPQDGVMVYETVKEVLQKAIDDGVFDDVKNIVVGYSNDNSYNTHWHGNKFECAALGARVAHTTQLLLDDAENGGA